MPIIPFDMILNSILDISLNNWNLLFDRLVGKIENAVDASINAAAITWLFSLMDARQYNSNEY